MRRALLLLATIAALAAPRGEVLAQGGVPAPPDTVRGGVRYVHFIRHAQYDHRDPRDARLGKGLDSLGRVQSRLTAERLAGLPVRMDLLVSSTFTRARETADLLGEALHLSAVRDSDVCECTAPSYRPDYYVNHSAAARDSCQAAWERAFARYVRPAGGREDRHDVIVSHGNMIRWMVTKALGMPTERWPDYDIGNCSITTILIRADGSKRLAGFSDVGHLPPALQTWTGRGAGWSPAPSR